MVRNSASSRKRRSSSSGAAASPKRSAKKARKASSSRKKKKKGEEEERQGAEEAARKRQQQEGEADPNSESSEEEDDGVEYVPRPGAKRSFSASSKKMKGSRLNTKVFHTHFRSKLPKGQKRKKTVRWSDAETAALRRGQGKHGNKWTAILKEERVHFHASRTSVDLKDKWRSLEKTRNTAATPKGGRKKAGKKSPSSGKTPAEAVTYSGDVKIRGWLAGARKQQAKMTAPGHTTLTEVVEFCRQMAEPNNFMDGVIDVTIRAGHDESALRSVATGERVGDLVDPEHDASGKKAPYVFVELSRVKGRNNV